MRLRDYVKYYAAKRLALNITNPAETPGVIGISQPLFTIHSIFQWTVTSAGKSET
jgi:hypothetical protein